jgi:biopolymer transport protein ExbD
VIFGGDVMEIAALAQPLQLEARYLKLSGKKSEDATIIIRADADAKGGVVQEVMQKCQENGFDNFALRAKQEDTEEP